MVRVRWFNIVQLSARVLVAAVLMAVGLVIAAPQAQAAQPEVCVVEASGDTTGFTDRQAFNTITKLHQNEPVIIKFEAGETYYIDTSLWLWNNTTVKADGATVYQVTPGKPIFVNAYFYRNSNSRGDVYDGVLYGEERGLTVHDGTEPNYGESARIVTKGGYDRCKNIKISGGRYISTGQPDTSSGLKDTGFYSGCSNFLFMHGQNITIENCSIENCYNGHMIELAGVKNATISNVRLIGSYIGDDTNEAIQLDTTCNDSVSPTGAPWDGTTCKNITIKDSWICVAGMQRGIGTNRAIKSDAYKYSNINISNNVISAKTYAIALFETKNSTVANNTLYQGYCNVHKTCSNVSDTNNIVVSGSRIPFDLIKQTFLRNSTIALSPAGFDYDGTAKTIDSCTLTVNGTQLTQGVDYAVLSYDNNVEIGVATATITGTGSKYMGLATVEFGIYGSSGMITRLWGDTSLETMGAIVDAGWSGQTGGAVFVARADNFKDALTAAGLAGQMDAPVILTETNRLSPQTKSLLTKLKPAKVIVVGGTAAVSANTFDQIKSALPNATVKRYAGADSIATANAIAKAGIGKWSDTAILVTNKSFKDALSAAPIAFAKNMPIFLASYNPIDNSTVVTADTCATMKACGIKNVVVVGGTAAVPYSAVDTVRNSGFKVAVRLWGEDSIETSQKVAEYAITKQGMSADLMGVATNMNFKDALCGAPLCGKNGSVLVLVNEWDTSAATNIVSDYLDYITRVYVFGGPVAVPEAVEGAIDNALLGL